MFAAPLNRRNLIRGAGLGGAGLLLPGCATTMSATGAATGSSKAPARTCLPPVRVSPDRLIRTVAGLRPYRPGGFRVEREALGDKALVHNYGHGGAGITLSWGTSRLALDLGLPGHSGPVAVLGAGIVGLTTARLVQEAGFPVTIYAAQLPPETTSNIAGGQIHAYGYFDRDAVSSAWQAQAARAEEYAWRRWQLLTGKDTGVRWLTTYAESSRGPGPHMPGFERLTASAFPFGTENLIRYDTMYVETGRFLRELSQEVQIAGGRILVRRFASRVEVAALPERLVFNCTGLGAGALFGDSSIYPVRGQLAVLLPQPEVQYAFNGSAGYMFPRADGILLGGTFEQHQADPTPQPDDIARIVASHQKLFAGFTC